MASSAPIPEALSTLSPRLPFPVIPAVPLTAAQLPWLVEDFFSWLQDEWQLPVLSLNPAPPPLLHPPHLLDEKLYSAHDLSQLWGWPYDKAYHHLRTARIPLADSPLTHPGKGWPNLYRGQDLLPVVQYWEWERLSNQIDAHWRRFFHEPCGSCHRCKTASENEAVWVYCDKNNVAMHYRHYFFTVLKGIQKYSSLAAWWKSEFQTMQANPSNLSPRDNGLILLYLLDRRFLALSWEEIALVFPLNGITWEDIGRPWRIRRPGEYATFVETLTNIRSSPQTRLATLGGMALLLLQYGLKGVAELSRQLTTDEIEEAVQQRFLLTSLLYADVYLPYPQSPDTRLGHLLLDTLRMFVWQHNRVPVGGKRRKARSAWPTPFNIYIIKAIEETLCSLRWDGKQGILVPRPETKGVLINRYRRQQDFEQKGEALSQLPASVKEQVTAFIRKRHREDHIALSTLRRDVESILKFLHFVQRKFGLERIDKWNRKECNEVFQEYDTQECKDLSDGRRYRIFNQLLIWFDTLAELEIPVPPGYSTLRKFTTRPDDDQTRDVPPEALMDRVFRDGVCQHPELYIRLALTIQYFCGTRITETLDMHLLCMWQDEEDGRDYLTIPIGKNKEERKFPIVPEGMTLLVDLIEQATQSQLSSGELRPQVQANHKYLATDLAKASSWYYLFDRFTQHDGPGRRRAVLSPERVRKGLREAVLLAAQVDPSHLFVAGTYNQRCQRQVKSGEHCEYVAMRAGVTTCPICGGGLAGKRGEKCWCKLKADYVCNGVATDGAWFCPVCDAPLAKPIRFTTHLFRHNSVTRASRRGVPLIENMALHGHHTLRMHMLYNHPELKELYERVKGVMAAIHYRASMMQALSTPRQVVVDGVAQTPSLEQYFGLTLSRSWQRETSGIWGGFVAILLSHEEGVESPLKGGEQIYITEQTYAHTVAQYRYDSLGLAISEVSLEYRTRGKHRAQVPGYLNRQAIEKLVKDHPALNEELSGNLSIRLIQGEIKRQRARLAELAAILQPWWNHYGSIDQLVVALTTPGMDPFYQEVSDGA